MTDITLNENASKGEILYRLGRIEAELKHNGNAWTGPLQNLERSIEKLSSKIDEDLLDVKVDVTENKHKIAALEKELAAWKTRVSTIIAAVSVVWIVVGDAVHDWIGKVV